MFTKMAVPYVVDWCNLPLLTMKMPIKCISPICQGNLLPLHEKTREVLLAL